MFVLTLTLTVPHIERGSFLYEVINQRFACVHKKQSKQTNKRKPLKVSAQKKRINKTKKQASKQTKQKKPQRERERKRRKGRARARACVCVWVVCAHEKTKQGKQTSKQKPFKVSARKKKKKKWTSKQKKSRRESDVRPPHWTKVRSFKSKHTNMCSF